MMDCKKALEESNGDLETATDILRKKGQIVALKKAGRVHYWAHRRCPRYS